MERLLGAVIVIGLLVWGFSILATPDDPPLSVDADGSGDDAAPDGPPAAHEPAPDPTEPAPDPAVGEPPEPRTAPEHAHEKRKHKGHGGDD
ncbi:MAG TPA: hypothetical protein VM370_08250 [Candidatus Thermoplasmatota archaeon]|nr:hypothetical protein [Candidatus Thermoplasmatota archaeon]